MVEILKLSPYYYPEKISSSHLTDDLNKAFIEAGFHTVTYSPTPCRGIDKETRKKYKKIRHETIEKGSIDIYRFPLFREGKNPIFRAFRYLLCNLIQYRKGKRASNVDIILAGSTPPTQGLLCAKVKKKLCKRYGHNVPFVYNLQDIFPDSLVNAKMTKKGSLIWKIGRKIEDYTYKNADVIITISEDFKANIMAKGVPEDKIVVIPNWVNTDNVYPVDRKDNILFDRYGLDRNLFYICYSGNIGHSQNFDMLLDVAKEIDIPDIRFVLIGDGAAKDTVEQRIKNENIENVIMLPFQDYSEIAHVFSLGDVGLIISKPGVGGSSVPSKTYSIMAAERPILASFDLDSELSRIISRIGCGIVTEAGKKDELTSGIMTFYNGRSTHNNGIGREYVTDYYSKDRCIEKYMNVIQHLLRGENIEE